MALCGVSMATVYQVGDSTGWTSMGQVDYQDWAASKNFHGGDQGRSQEFFLSWAIK
ncbi:hypothetical protein NC653_006606 [Populus alba x Populus x berolinensis]|nr:hypothetical protein NC653_006606 [Populus alba x Populus x berolinensis]